MSYTIEQHMAIGTKPWLAQISGTSGHYGLSRDFVKVASVRRSKSGRTGTYTWDLQRDGLYEIGGAGRDGRFFTLLRHGDEWTEQDVSDDDAQEMARIMTEQDTDLDGALEAMGLPR